MKRVLVTGGLGYIGSHTVVALQQANYEVVIIDDLSNADEAFLQRIEDITSQRPAFYPIDLKNEQAVNDFFAQEKVDGIIHFAAFKAVGESVQEPLKYYRNNIVGIINVLEAMEKYGVDHFIFSSSCTVYGQADTMPIHENTPLKRPEAPYGKTKHMGEEIMSDWVQAKHKNAIALRYFNPVGAHASGLIGEIPKGIPNNLLPYITQTAAGLREALGVFGNDYDTRDGTAVRDYIDVNDLADAHVSALSRLLNKANEEPLEFFNLGSGTGSTVLEMIKAFEQANGLKIKYQIEPRRAGDIQEAFADFSKAKEKLQWTPKISLQESMKNAWEFQKKIDNPLEQ